MKTGSDSTIPNLQASSVGGLVLLLMLAGNVVAVPKIVTSLVIPGGPAGEGAVDPSLYRVYGDMIEGLLPVAIVCVVSLLGTAVWLLAAGAHLRSGSGHAA
jgi:hypothetical protein